MATVLSIEKNGTRLQRKPQAGLHQSTKSDLPVGLGLRRSRSLLLALVSLPAALLRRAGREVSGKKERVRLSNKKWSLLTRLSGAFDPN